MLHLPTRSTARVPHGALIVATGATDRVLPLPGWTLPGVYTLGGAQVALKFQGCAIGQRVVFMGTGPLLYLVAYQYAKAGAKIYDIDEPTLRKWQAIARDTAWKDYAERNESCKALMAAAQKLL